MPSNRVKIDINDDDGSKFTISLEGHLSRDKVLKILDFVDLLGTSSAIENTGDLNSKFEKMRNVIFRKFPIGWFTSQEVMIAYEDSLEEPIGLSTVSTYLTRLATKGFIKKTGSAAKRKYKIVAFTKKSDTDPKYNVPI